MRWSLIYFLFCFSGIVTAQTTTALDWGNIYKKNRHSEFTGIIGQTDKNFYALRYVDHEPVIEVFDEQLNYISSSPLVLLYKEKEMDFVGLHQIDDHFIVLMSFSNLKLKRNFLFYRRIGLDSLDLQAGRLKKIAEIPYQKKRYEGAFHSTLSPDSSMLLIYSSKTYTENGPEKYGFTVLDKKMQLIWERDIRQPYDHKPFHAERFALSNQAQVYLSGKEHQAEFSGSRDGSVPQYHLLRYDQAGTILNDLPIELDGKYVTDLTFTIDEEAVKCAGYYSLQGLHSIKGHFYWHIDPNSWKPNHQIAQSFSPDFILQEWENTDSTNSKRAKRRKRRTDQNELPDYTLRQAISKPDGGMILLGEQYYVHEHARQVHREEDMEDQSRTIHHFFYNHIIATNLDEEGKVIWNTRINKEQHSTNDDGYYSSFATATDEAGIWLVYNESAKDYHNQSSLQNMSGKERREQYTISARISADGSVKKQVLTKMEPTEVLIRPKVCRQTSENVMVLYGKWYKKQRLAILSLQ